MKNFTLHFEALILRVENCNIICQYNTKLVSFDKKELKIICSQLYNLAI